MDPKLVAMHKVTTYRVEMLYNYLQLPYFVRCVNNMVVSVCVDTEYQDVFDNTYSHIERTTVRSAIFKQITDKLNVGCL